MQLVSAKSRIAFGQVCLLGSILLLAIVLGIVPDRRQAVLDGRANLCEAIAINSSILVSRNDLQRLEAILHAVVKRNDDLRSAGIRRADGTMVVEVADHLARWQPLSHERSVEEQLQVAIRAGEGGREKWGSVEFCFEPLRTPGVWGWLSNPLVRLMAFVGALSLILNYHYLGKMLAQLDPSKAIPARVRSALDRLAEGLLVIDRRGRVVLANEALANNLGTTAEKLVGRDAGALGWTGGDGAAIDGPSPWQTAMTLGSPQLGVTMGLQTAPGVRRTFMVNATPVMDHQGKCRGAFTSFDDVTQLQETKAELEISKAEAEAANNAKSEFLARMSHEIRTPMNAILGFTEVLRRGFDISDGDRLEYLDTIHTSGQHLLTLINDILDLSKVEAGKLDVESKPCQPLAIISEVVAVMQARADEKALELKMETEGEIPETITSDPTRLRQIVTNLVGNAIKFTEHGSVSVVARLDESGSEPLLAVDVRDTGIGMSTQAQANIFNPFAQADTSVTRRFGGTGLGLSISKRFAEALGGSITVASEEGAGSVFTATIATGPIDGVSRVAAAMISKTTRASERSRGIIRLPHARILVADDGDANRKLVSLVLGRAGASVDEAENGEVAVQKATAAEYDVILMDMQMPVVDGLTATRQLRDAGLGLPIIALTADAMKGAEERCLQAGCTGYLTKPIDMDRLLQTLAQQLGVDPSDQPVVSKTEPSVARVEPSGSDDEAIEQIATTVHELNELGHAVRAVPESEATNAGPAPEQATEDASVGAEPIRSNLPTDDPEIREIVSGWTARLDEQLAEMRRAFESGDFAQLAQLAHWLKGSAGTLGFSQFTEIARNLEDYAKQEQVELVSSTLDEVQALAGRIERPAAQSS